MKSFFCLVGIFCFSIACFGEMIVHCGSLICGDLVPDSEVDAYDHACADGTAGERMTVDISCLEGPTAENGYNDMSDTWSWSWRLNEDDALTACPWDPFQSFMNGIMGGSGLLFSSTAGAGFGSSLLVTGRVRDQNGIYSSDEGLFIYDSQGSYVSDPFSTVDARCNTRLFCDTYGKIFQLNTKIGLVRLNDGAAVVTPGRFSIAEDPRYEAQALVAIGIQSQTTQWGTDFGGRPIMDAAVDAQGYIYVTPVVVIPSGDTSLTYLAGAKLQLQPGQSPCYSIVRLYDDPPGQDDDQDPLRYGLDEIEVDSGGNVYITNSHYSIYDDTASNFLWVYPADNSAPTKVALDTISGVTGGIPNPTGLFASKKNQMVYLASGVNSPEATSVKVYGLTTQNLSLTLSRTVQINAMGHVTAMAEDPISGSLWVTGFKMENIPSTPDLTVAPFYHGCLVQIPTTSNDPVQATCLDSSSSIAMPYSIAWMPANLISSVPIDQQYLWRSYKNICRLTFDGDITTPAAGSVLIQEMLDNGQYGQDLSSNFTITVENDINGKPRILRIYETTQCLPNRKWLAVRNTGSWTGVAKFTVQYPIQKGDANDDGDVTVEDQAFVTTGIINFNCPDYERRDVNGDRKITTLDHGALQAFYPATPVVKPSGH